MTEWTLTLPMLPMSMNNRERVSHWTRKRELDQLKTAIHYLAREQRIPEALDQRWVQIIIHKTLRSRVTDDPANRDSRAKSILDAMVHNRLLVDDSDKWLAWGGVIEGDKRTPAETTIAIRDTWGEAA